MTPVEFDWALQDFDKTQFTPMKRICETLRMVAQVVYNSTPGRERSDMINNPRRLLKFGWETPQVQTVGEMKSFMMGLAHMGGVKVKQNGEEVDPFKTDDENEITLTRTK